MLKSGYLQSGQKNQLKHTGNKMLFAAMSCYQGQTMSFALDKIKNL